MSDALMRSGWDLIEDLMRDVASTVSVMSIIADHVEDEEKNRASALDALTRHLLGDLEALARSAPPSTNWLSSYQWRSWY